MKQERFKLYSFVFSLVLLVTLTASLYGGESGVFVPDKVEGVKEKKEGFTPSLKAIINFSYSHNKNVVGQDDGSTYNIGSIITGRGDYYNKNGHEWRNELNWQLQYLRTPQLPVFVKSLDLLTLSSTYLYHLKKTPWIGPFANLTLNTSVLTGRVIKASDTTVKYIGYDGSSYEKTFDAFDSIDLTKPLSPTVLREALGVFMDPLKSKPANLHMKLGWGAWEVFGRGGWVVADDPDTPELEVQRLHDSFQTGLEFSANFTGVQKEIFTYRLFANFMYPFYNNADTELSGLDLLNMEFEANLGVKPASWISVSYTFKAYKYPLVLDDWQISNGLFVSLVIDIL